MHTQLIGPARPRHSVDSPAALQALVGLPAAVSRPHRIGQSMIGGFADLTDDRQWIHVDAERAAREGPSGGTIAHGFLVLSLLTSWHLDCVEYPGAKSLVNYGFDKLRFTAPVAAGATVSAAFQLQDADMGKPGQARCTWKVEVRTDASDRPAIVADWVVLVHFDA